MHDDYLTYQHVGKLLDYLSVGMAIMSPQRRILFLNRTAEEMTGQEAAKVTGQLCHAVLANDLCDGECICETAGDPGRRVVKRLLEIPDAGDNIRTVLKLVTPLAMGDGGHIGCMEVFQDISAYFEMIDRVGEEERNLRTILDHIDVGIFSCDRGGHITFFNAMAETITGYRRREVLGKNAREFFVDAMCRSTEATSRMETPESAPKAVDVEIKARDGRTLPVRVKHLPMTSWGGADAGTMTTFTDLSLLHQYRNALSGRSTFYDMVSRDPYMHKIFDIIPAVAESNATVLIEGPTGSGKDLMAQVIHTASQRKNKPLVKVNCAALPDNLLESEMFGYAKGAFTGAERDKPGRFQDADGGTIFLDEIGDLPLALQAKLLRVIEDREFYPLGGRQTTKVDVRILSATNRGLADQVARGEFREDLYYRLNVMRIELPPLKDRPSDIPILIAHVLKKLSATPDAKPVQLTEAAMEALLNYEYPGNIRELENILAHALIVCRGESVDRHHLPFSLQKIASPAPVDRPVPAAASIRDEMALHERDRIRAMLETHHGNKTNTAKSLNIDRTTLWRKMKRYGLN